ncbi:helix-turn-helix domain-containing protein [Neotabrizicola sp. sgz301269]|uniref:helix-turn-helix domain-containing protein n=1 Tax=Neotabrizicola sp. sgz301269 TaxID=3276282 RepID=UPI00376F855C
MRPAIKEDAACKRQLANASSAREPIHACADINSAADLLHKKADSVISHAIGQELRAIRRSRKMTISDLAQETGLSISMMSRMENGSACPSINTLRLLSRALSTPLMAFFRSYEKEFNVQYVKSIIDTDVSLPPGFEDARHLLLRHSPSPESRLFVEPYLFVLTQGSTLECDAPRDGVKLIYILSGELTYRHGKQISQLRSGDTLFFYSGVPHGPERIVTSIVRYISVCSRLRN